MSQIKPMTTTLIIAVVNQKGGVGKTTTAVNLAAALAEAGQRVLLVDLDPQTNATSMLQIAPAATSVFDALVAPATTPIASVITPSSIAGLDVVPGHRAMVGLESALRDVLGREMLLSEALSPIRDLYNTIIIDNGPALGVAPAMALCAADVALVPVQCQPLALEGLGQICQTILVARQRLNPRLKQRLVLTMYDPRKAVGTSIVNNVRKQFGDNVFASVIPTSADLERAPLHGGSVLTSAPRSKAAIAYRELASEMMPATQEAHGG